MQEDLHPDVRLATSEAHLSKLAGAMRRAGANDQLLKQVTDRLTQIQVWRRNRHHAGDALESAEEWALWWINSEYARRGSASV